MFWHLLEEMFQWCYFVTTFTIDRSPVNSRFVGLMVSCNFSYTPRLGHFRPPSPFFAPFFSLEEYAAGVLGMNCRTSLTAYFARKYLMPQKPKSDSQAGTDQQARWVSPSKELMVWLFCVDG